MTHQNLKTWLRAEPFTLAMSSGFFSFFAHTGMLTALLEEDCIPAKITGSSAGALVGAGWASGHDLETLHQSLFSLKKADFWDPGFGFGLLKGQRFRENLAATLKVHSFEECRVPLNLSVYDIVRGETEVLKTGDLVAAVYASCAVPLLFQPAKIQGRYYLDGGIKDRPALASVVPGERLLYHHIKSRSPWRRKNSSALQIPQRENMQVIALDDIPRVGPDQLAQGREAFSVAYAGTKAKLNNHDNYSAKTETTY